MEVISLFDGMSCLQIALKELGIIPEKYYSSEIDKFAIAQTQLNFPNTIQLGNIENWQSWDIDWSKVDLIGAGSPCQGFSFAGKQLNFKDERSKLFFVFVDILNHAKKFNPDVKFLLENVNMKKEYQKVINDYLGLFPVRINSNLVSAQNRDRLYWSNIKIKMVGLFNEIHTDIPQPEDKGIILKDILENDVDEKYYLSDKAITGSLNHKIRHKNKKNGFGINLLTSDKKSNSLLQIDYKGNQDIICVKMVGRKLDENGIRKDNSDIKAKQQLEQNSNNKTNCLTNTQKDNLLTDGYKLRRLTPTECARLQNIPDWYKWNCSNTQQYKMLGNGWTIEVIKHIFLYL